MMLLMAQLQQETSVLSDLGTQASDEVWDEQKQKTEALKVNFYIELLNYSANLEVYDGLTFFINSFVIKHCYLMYVS